LPACPLSLLCYKTKQGGGNKDDMQKNASCINIGSSICVVECEQHDYLGVERFGIGKDEGQAPRVAWILPGRAAFTDVSTWTKTLRGQEDWLSGK
jgi:hypothetical protein